MSNKWEQQYAGLREADAWLLLLLLIPEAAEIALLEEYAFALPAYEAPIEE